MRNANCATLKKISLKAQRIAQFAHSMHKSPALSRTQSQVCLKL